MIKSGLKNYFVNLKYYFTPVGTLALGMIIGLSILIPTSLSALSQMLNGIIEIVSDTQVDFSSVKDCLIESIMSLEWIDPIESLKTMLSADWLNSTLTECFRAFSVELQPYGDAIAIEVNTAISTVKTSVAIFVVFSIIGLVSGYFLTRFLVRRNIAKRSLRKFIFATLIDALITTVLQILCVWLYAIWKPSVIFTTLLSLALFALVSLLEAYLIHGRGMVDIKQILNAKNCVYLILSDLIIFYLSIAILFIAIAITNAIAGIFIGFAFVEIAFIVITLNAESYVLKYVQNINEEPTISVEEVEIKEEDENNAEKKTEKNE